MSLNGVSGVLDDGIERMSSPSISRDPQTLRYTVFE